MESRGASNSNCVPINQKVPIGILPKKMWVIAIHVPSIVTNRRRAKFQSENIFTDDTGSYHDHWSGIRRINLIPFSCYLPLSDVLAGHSFSVAIVSPQKIYPTKLVESVLPTINEKVGGL